MEKDFPLSEAVTAYYQTGNEGLAAYVITKHRDGWIMRTDAPYEVDGEWMGNAARRRWAINEAKRQRKVIRQTNF